MAVQGPFDDVVGTGFAIVSPASYVDRSRLDFLKSIGTQLVRVGGDIKDVEGKYAAGHRRRPGPAPHATVISTPALGAE